MFDLDDLKRKAEACGSAAWEYKPDTDTDGWVGHLNAGSFVSGYDGQWPRAQAEFAAAANPQAVLALIAEIERLRRDNECTRSCCAEGSLNHT